MSNVSLGEEERGLLALSCVLLRKNCLSCLRLRVLLQKEGGTGDEGGIYSRYGSRRGFDEGNSSFGSDLKHMQFIFHYDLFPYKPAIYLLLDLSPRCCDFIIVGYLSKVLRFNYCWISLQGALISLSLDLSPRCCDFIIVGSLSKVL